MIDAMAFELVYETHSISVDNERRNATGWELYDCAVPAH
jgi:hypothetical protein